MLLIVTGIFSITFIVFYHVLDVFDFCCYLSEVGSVFHVFGVEYLLGEFKDGKSAILLRTAGYEKSETSHEEIKTAKVMMLIVRYLKSELI